MNIPLWAVVLLMVMGFALTYGAFPLAKRWAPRYGLVAPPGGRRNHAQDTPLTGGWALFLPLMLTFLVLFGLALTDHFVVGQSDWLRMLSLFLGTIWILILGTIDDREKMGWRHKLLGRFLGGLILVLGGHTVTVATIPWLGLVNLAGSASLFSFAR